MCAQDRATIGELSKYKKYRHEKSIAPEEKACVYSSKWFLNVCSSCGNEVYCMYYRMLIVIMFSAPERI